MPPVRQQFGVYPNDVVPVPTAKQEGGEDQRRRRLLVRADDQRVVLAAIDNTITVAKASRKEKYASDADSAAKEEFFARCIDQVGESLKQNLAVVTTRADNDDELEEKLDAFQMRLLSSGPPSPSSDESADDDQSLSSSDDDGEDFEFDDRDIVDERAYGQVKELRQRARELSARAISVREEATSRAIEFSRQCLTELLQVHGFDCGDEDAGETDEGSTSDNTKGDLASMDVALQALASSLQGVDTNLAEKVESIKDTIGTIDDTLVKYQRMSQGDASALSQTEKALIARDEPRSHVRDDGDDDGDDESPMNPDKTLARLLAGVL